MQIICNDAEDKILIAELFDAANKFIFGKNSAKSLKQFSNEWRSYVSEIKLVDDLDEINYKNDDISHINIMLDNVKSAFSNDMNTEKVVIINNLFHSFASILPMLYAKYPNGLNVDGYKRINSKGCIVEYDDNKNLVNDGCYGIAFRDMMMDMSTIIALNHFDSNKKDSLSADEVLGSKDNSLKYVSDESEILYLLTKLMIFACSNNPNVKYNEIIDKLGYGVSKICTLTDNGKKVWLNDFIYGIYFDQMHIQRQFDEFTVDGAYAAMCLCIDNMYMKGNINLEELRTIMSLITMYFIAKNRFYTDNNIMSTQRSKRMMSNYSMVLDALEKKCACYSDKEDLNNDNTITYVKRLRRDLKN